jgi:Sel1 repeat
MRIPVLLFAVLGLASAALGDEFKAYRRPDPKVFAQGVMAYDAGDYRRAFDLWLPLARTGDLAAAFNIGLMLRDGRGVPKDEPRALTFFKKSAERGHLGSEVNLAKMYYEGIGTPPNYLEAARWLMILSRRGHYPSMYKLAGMFERGEGIQRNLKAARTLYLIAYKGGYRLAGNRLSQLAEKANEARAEPEGPAQSTVARLEDPSDASLGRDATAAEASSALPVLRLRGPIGAVDDTEPGKSEVFALRATISEMSALEQQIYRIGSTAKTVPGDEPARLEPAGPPRMCASRSRFDASATVCRMRPVRY